MIPLVELLGGYAFELLGRDRSDLMIEITPNTPPGPPTGAVLTNPRLRQMVERHYALHPEVSSTGIITIRHGTRRMLVLYIVDMALTAIAYRQRSKGYTARKPLKLDINDPGMVDQLCNYIDHHREITWTI